MPKILKPLHSRRCVGRAILGLLRALTRLYINRIALIVVSIDISMYYLKPASQRG